MRTATCFLALFFLFSLNAYAQDSQATASAMRASELLARSRAALGGEAQLNSVRSLSLSGRFHRQRAGTKISGELKIELLLPDKFLRSENSNPQPLTFVTTLLAVNGRQVWMNRQVNRPTSDDGSVEQPRGPASASTVEAARASGMRGAAGGNTVTRVNTPTGNTSSEQSVLGARIPTAQGPELNNRAAQISEEKKASSHLRLSSDQAPGLKNPGVRAALESQLRKEFISLALVWLMMAPATVPLEFSYGGAVTDPHGNVEAIEIKGPDDFAARLFLDQTTHLPKLLSYRELISRNAGYVVTAPAPESGENKSEEMAEIAVQLYFYDYRQVGGIRLPFQIIKAVNGKPVDEWRIEKYKLNPDLKPKKFEQK
jgi:hypothetical protein